MPDDTVELVDGEEVEVVVVGSETEASVVFQYWEPTSHHSSERHCQVYIWGLYAYPSPLVRVTIMRPSEFRRAPVTAGTLVTWFVRVWTAMSKTGPRETGGCGEESVGMSQT